MGRGQCTASSCSQHGSVPGGCWRGKGGLSAAQPSRAPQKDHLCLHLCKRVMEGLNLLVTAPKGTGTQLQAPAKKHPARLGRQPLCDRGPWLCLCCSVPCDGDLCSPRPGLRATQSPEMPTAL